MEYAVFLRGINVGGVRIGMEDLKQCLIIAGFEDVKTYLQSGNVRCTSVLERDEVREHLEAVLSFRFGYQARVVVHTPHEVSSIVQGWPWADTPPSCHRYAVLSSEYELLQQMGESARSVDWGTQRVVLGDLALYWEVPKGETVTTELSKLFLKPQYVAATTTRNLNTLERMLRN